ncbi:MAG: TetR/AcrR family transcriptional regulator [Acidimicrobiia bacterium]
MSQTDTRTEVIAASGRLFAERGIAGTTMRAIAEACDIQAASLYHHFESKDDLVAEIMNASSRHLVGLYEAIAAADLDPIARFEAIIRATLENFTQHPDAARIFYDNPSYYATAPSLEQVRSEARFNDRVWVATIDAAIAAGVLRSDIKPSRLKLHLRNMIWSSARGMRRGRAATDEDADDIVTLLMYGCVVGSLSD